jgi:hypothetical protein
LPQLAIDWNDSSVMRAFSSNSPTHRKDTVSVA